MKSHKSLTIIFQAAAAGLLAGALVGAGEVLLLVVLGANPGALQALLWAVLAYGLLGLLMGLALGILLAILRRKWEAPSAYALSFALVFASLGLFITRYRLYRDLFHESIRTFSLQGLLFNGGLLLAFAALFFLFLWLWQRPALRPMTHLWGSVVAFALVVIVAAVATLATRPSTLWPPPRPASRLAWRTRPT